MKLLRLVLLAAIGFAAVSSSWASCQYDSDRAADGSRCGKRSAESRDGGK